MKLKIAAFLLAVWILLLASGCQIPSNELSGGRVTLPAIVAGTWKAKGSPWKIVLSPKGTVTSAVIPMGEVEVRPNRTTKVEMKDGSFSAYKAGDFVVEYAPETRELFVSVRIEEIHIRFLDNAIDGSSTDRFVGPVSEDGRTWMADWISVFDYGPRFPQDPNDIGAEPLIFEKVEE